MYAYIHTYSNSSEHAVRIVTSIWRVADEIHPCNPPRSPSQLPFCPYSGTWSHGHVMLHSQRVVMPSAMAMSGSAAAQCSSAYECGLCVLVFLHESTINKVKFHTYTAQSITCMHGTRHNTTHSREQLFAAKIGVMKKPPQINRTYVLVAAMFWTLLITSTTRYVWRISPNSLQRTRG